jgi:ethanolamine utilization protein EutN
VTLSICHPSLVGSTWLVAVPLSAAGLAGKQGGRGESLVLLDEHGAGLGARIAVAAGPEASNPFRPELKPIDAYNTAILDSVEFG